MVKPFKKEHVEKSSSSRVTYLYWEQMERGGGGGKQVYSRAEGWLVKGLLRALTSSSLSCLLSCHPWAPWWMLTVTAVLRPPQPITPLTHQPPPHPPHSSSPLHSAPCPALTVARSELLGVGAKCLSLAVKSTSRMSSATHPWLCLFGGQLCLSLLQANHCVSLKTACINNFLMIQLKWNVLGILGMSQFVTCVETAVTQCIINNTITTCQSLFLN